MAFVVPCTICFPLKLRRHRINCVSRLHFMKLSADIEFTWSVVDPALKFRYFREGTWDM